MQVLGRPPSPAPRLWLLPAWCWVCRQGAEGQQKKLSSRVEMGLQNLFPLGPMGALQDGNGPHQDLAEKLM